MSAIHSASQFNQFYVRAYFLDQHDAIPQVLRSVWSAGDWQVVFPPGQGGTQVRVRVCRPPPPHVRLHADQPPHVVQSPAKQWKKTKHLFYVNLEGTNEQQKKKTREVCLALNVSLSVQRAVLSHQFSTMPVGLRGYFMWSLRKELSNCVTIGSTETENVHQSNFGQRDKARITKLQLRGLFVKIGIVAMILKRSTSSP